MAGSIPTVGLRRTRTRYSSSTTNVCSSAINSHCQIIKAEAVRTTGFSPDISSSLPSAGPAIRWSTGICFGYLLFALSPQFRSSQRSLQCGRGFHLSAAKTVCFEGFSERLFECERRQRLSIAAHLFVHPSGMVKETLET